jgi:hypothetical protein
MANVRILKRDIRYVIGDIIDAIYVWEMTSEGKPSEASSSLLMESIKVYDELMTRINQKPAENAKSHFKSVRKDFENAAFQLVEKVNALN